MTSKVRSKKARFVLAAGFGVVAAVAVGLLLGWEYALLVGWDTFALTMVALVWLDFAKHSSAQTASVARQDAMNPSVLDAIILIASLASLGAVGVLLSGKSAGNAHIIVGLVSIIVTWAAVHTLYALRYTTLYYRGTREGGVDFNSNARPAFIDFAYLAFTIGMTYQVSDTTITDAAIRKTVLGHAVVSFVFGVAIIAGSINFLVSLTG